MKKFEIGKIYTIVDNRNGAWFTGTVTKRTACTVTFQLSGKGQQWCGVESVTLRKAKSDYIPMNADNEEIEEVIGCSKGKVKRYLFTHTENEKWI